MAIPAGILFCAGFCSLCGIYTVQPGEARVLMLFGDYKGTIKSNGLFWVNPFYEKGGISTKAQNLQGHVIRVNDKGGNPIEIAVVVVWQVEDTYRARFDVDNYTSFVAIQSEAAVRHMASMYPYDTFDDNDHESLTLRGGQEEVRHVLEKELTERFHRAGIKVIEARISHLAYAPEIASAMLKRQEAIAVVSARTQIVNGAISMVEMALQKLAAKNTVNMTEDQKAQLVSNMLVVLCSESQTNPTVNVGHR
jgi:regulator of protease activity HflC (stomatin/prohibitin superfamily)